MVSDITHYFPGRSRSEEQMCGVILTMGLWPPLLCCVEVYVVLLHGLLTIVVQRWRFPAVAVVGCIRSGGLWSMISCLCNKLCISHSKCSVERVGFEDDRLIIVSSALALNLDPSRIS